MFDNKVILANLVDQVNLEDIQVDDHQHHFQVEKDQVQEDFHQPLVAQLMEVELQVLMIIYYLLLLLFIVTIFSIY